MQGETRPGAVTQVTWIVVSGSTTQGEDVAVAMSVISHVLVATPRTCRETGEINSEDLGTSLVV